jgi:hypothetical protein
MCLNSVFLQIGKFNEKFSSPFSFNPETKIIICILMGIRIGIKSHTKKLNFLFRLFIRQIRNRLDRRCRVGVGVGLGVAASVAVAVGVGSGVSASATGWSVRTRSKAERLR